MELLYATGMRVSELVSLPVAAARGNPKLLLVRGKGDKERLVPLSQPAKNALAAWLAHRDAEDDIARQDGRPVPSFLFPSRAKQGHLTSTEGPKSHITKQMQPGTGKMTGLERQAVSPSTKGST